MIEVLANDLFALHFDVDVVVNASYYDPANYAITVSGGFPIEIIEVLSVDTVVTRVAYLRTTRHSAGGVYSFSVSNLSKRDLTNLAVQFTTTSRETKVDLMSKGVPAHFSRDPSSIFRSIFIALGSSDDKIGGSRSEPVNFPPVTTEFVLATELGEPLVTEDGSELLAIIVS